MGAVALGIAARATDDAIQTAQDKVPVMSQEPLRARPLFQPQIAEATAAAARAWLYTIADEVWQMAQEGEVPLAERNLLWLAAAQATKCAQAAIVTVYLASGASANYNRSLLPRALRDIHALTQHLGTAPQAFVSAGRVLAGLEPDNPLLAF